MSAAAGAGTNPQGAAETAAVAGAAAATAADATTDASLLAVPELTVDNLEDVLNRVFLSPPSDRGWAAVIEEVKEMGTSTIELAGDVVLQIHRPSSGTSSRQVVLLFTTKKVRIESRPGRRAAIPKRVRTQLLELRVDSAGKELANQPKMRTNLTSACDWVGVKMKIMEWPAAVTLTTDNALWASSGVPDGRILAPTGDLKDFVAEKFVAVEFKTNTTGKEPVSWRQALDATLKLAELHEWEGAVLVLVNMWSILAVMEFVPAAGSDGIRGTIVVHTAAVSVAADLPEPKSTDCRDEDEVDDTVKHMIHHGTTGDFPEQLASGLHTAEACLKSWRRRAAAHGGAASGGTAAAAAGAASAAASS